MAESVIPETARQACEDWKLARFQSALTVNADDAVMDLQKWGDALAVLVPQLLDQLANMTACADAAGRESVRSATAAGEYHAQRDELLDQLATQKELATARERGLFRAAMEHGALGERCHQLEAALQVIKDEASSALFGHARMPYSVLGRIQSAARAALGDSHPSPMVTDTPPLEHEHATFTSWLGDERSLQPIRRGCPGCIALAVEPPQPPTDDGDADPARDRTDPESQAYWQGMK